MGILLGNRLLTNAANWIIALVDYSSYLIQKPFIIRNDGKNEFDEARCLCLFHTLPPLKAWLRNVRRLGGLRVFLARRRVNFRLLPLYCEAFMRQIIFVSGIRFGEILSVDEE